MLYICWARDGKTRLYQYPVWDSSSGPGAENFLAKREAQSIDCKGCWEEVILTIPHEWVGILQTALRDTSALAGWS